MMVRVIFFSPALTICGSTFILIPIELTKVLNALVILGSSVGSGVNLAKPIV